MAKKSNKMSRARLLPIEIQSPTLRDEGNDAPSVLFDQTRFDSPWSKWQLHWDSLLNIGLFVVGTVVLHYNDRHFKTLDHYYYYYGAALSLIIGSGVLMLHYFKELGSGFFRDDESERIIIQRAASRRTVHDITLIWFVVAAGLLLAQANVNYLLPDDFTKIAFNVCGAVVAADAAAQYTYAAYNYAKLRRVLRDVQ